MSVYKTYVLKKHTDSTAPIWIRINAEQRVRIEKRPIDHAYLQNTFWDEKLQKNRNIRLKLSSNTIDLEQQIKDGIPANTQYTQEERDAVKFVNGVLRTDNIIVQKFLEEGPQFEGFVGRCDYVKQPLFELYDKSGETKIANDDFRKRLKAANKIDAIDDLKVAQELMYRLNGSFFKAPDDLEECRNGLISFLDDADDLGLEKIMAETSTYDEEIMILVGKTVSNGFISFDQKPNQVSLKRNDLWVDIKMISSDHPPTERQRLFAQFLGLPEAKTLYEDLKRKIDGDVKTSKKKDQLVTQ